MTEAQTSEKAGRIQRWTQKLLDLSLRNRLLNVKDSKHVIPLAGQDVTVLEDKLAASDVLTLQPLSVLLEEQEGKKALQQPVELFSRELEKGRLWTSLTQQELNKRLVTLYRQARTDLEEGGVNTLFMALGFLEWRPAGRDERIYSAPILLEPIRLQRKTVAEGIRLSRIDEETVVNDTLLELLRSQFHISVPNLSPLPLDDSGVDVAKVFEEVRNAIAGMEGWKLREDACIGHFSFGKFIMWKDMTARMEELKQNPLVKHLVEGGGLYDDGVELLPLEDLQKHLELERLYCPMSADASQLAAVLNSAKGASFVLHGPPGTGKSQTITNIIAHNLALGRRVLFVSEKKAALDVVHKRLSNIGLRPFCLELHSNKSSKTDVLKQFAEALDVPHCSVSPEWSSTVSSLEQLGTQLNGYVQELHKIFPNGLSAYTCFSHILNAEFNMQDMLLDMDFLVQSRTQLEELQALAKDLAAAWCALEADGRKVPKFLNAAEWSPAYERALLECMDVFRRRSLELGKACSLLAQELNITAPAALEAIFSISRLCGTLKESCNIPVALVSPEFSDNIQFLQNYIGDKGKYIAVSEMLRQFHVDKLQDLDLAGIEARIAQNKQSFFIVRFFKNRALLKELEHIKKLGGAKLSIPELEKILPAAKEYLHLKGALEAAAPRAEQLLEQYWRQGDVDLEKTERMLKDGENVVRQLYELSRWEDVDLDKLLLFMKGLLPDLEKKLAERELGGALETLLQAHSAWCEAHSAANAYAEGFSAVENLSDLLEYLAYIVDNPRNLRGLLLYRSLSHSAGMRGMKKAVEALEAKKILPELLSSGFMELYSRGMLEQILLKSPLLCNFTGEGQDRRIQEFLEFDAKYTALARKIVFAKLAETLPRRRGGPCPEGTELGVLKRECEKRSRQKPVRQLLELIPTLVSVLKPCFLMSPLSVAQYLPADTASFDLIVFDEASQIPVWDAIGVIARGKQLIVVGDPKQMPPTNFFQKGESQDGDWEEETEDLESILDECIAAGVHSSHLNWHYRSKHEALIAFSNHYYYDDRLFTFPAARNTERLGVGFHFVEDAVYDRKSSRTNRKEAEALVEYVFRRLEQPGWKRRSVGIVTFSQAQKDLIEDLVEQERAKHPLLEPYFGEQQEEPFFVKNLENVQGDERDVILFSVCYAKDAEGKFSMNFGPLNRQGGERRLNVAITRAKEQVIVFSSIRGQDIDLSRTSAVGAAHLKHFLNYAENSLSLSGKDGGKDNVDGLMDIIANFLEEKGFRISRHVGCSGYKIDLAVFNPDNPEDYLLGIEGDGTAYAGQFTTRDREGTRNGVLKNLGWRTYRAWSVDWSFNRERAQEQLLEAIESARQAVANPPEPVIVPQVEELPAELPPPMPSMNRRQYVTWNCDRVLEQEDFYLPESQRLIRQQIEEIIQTEGPVCRQLLRKRIVRAWGFTRAGESIHNILNACMPADFLETQGINDTVLWPRGDSPDNFTIYRVSDNDEQRRALEDIPPVELVNAMREILADFASCEQDTLFRETVRLFGYSTLTAKARKILETVKL